MATRKAISNKFYVDGTGERSNSPTAESVTVGFEFYTGEKDKDEKNIVGSTVLLDTSKLSDGTRIQAMCHGLAQKIGDEWSGKGADAEEICGTMIERIMGGEWNMPSGAGSGPRPSMVLDAVLAVLFAKGAKDSEGLRAAVSAKLAVDGARKGALLDPAINAEFLRLKAESAAKRAKEAAAKAKAPVAEGDDVVDFLAGFNPEAEETADTAEVAE